MTTEAERPVSREPRGRDNRRIRAVPGLVPHRHAKAVLEVALRVYVTGAECEPVRLGVADRGRGRRGRERQYEHGGQEKVWRAHRATLGALPLHVKPSLPYR